MIKASAFLVLDRAIHVATIVTSYLGGYFLLKAKKMIKNTSYRRIIELSRKKLINLRNSNNCYGLLQ